MVRQRNRLGQGPGKAKRSLCRKDSSGSMSEIPTAKDESLYRSHMLLWTTNRLYRMFGFLMSFYFLFLSLSLPPSSPFYCRMDWGPARYTCGRGTSRTRSPWKNKETLSKEKNKTRGSFSNLLAGRFLLLLAIRYIHIYHNPSVVVWPFFFPSQLPNPNHAL